MSPAAHADPRLTTSARRALAHVVERAAARKGAARESIARVLARHGQSDGVARALVEAVVARAAVTLNFHPDRLGRDGASVAQGLLRDGAYRSQFETNVTSGSPTAFPGGARDLWEARLFGGAYHDPAAPAAAHERPKYGALDVMCHPDGGSPRFGSCYFVLSHAARARATFTWGDSYDEPEHAGTIDAFDTLLAAWLEAVETSGAAFGVGGLAVPMLVSKLTSKARDGQLADRQPGRALDDYIEAQVHGPIDLAHDVDALVIDPAFDGTATGDDLVAIASRYGLALQRHAGFVLHPAEVPDDFRGPRMGPLAARITNGTEFDAATLGRAAASLATEPGQWQDWGTEAETWQHIKQLWHVLVRYGRPRRISPST